MFKLFLFVTLFVLLAAGWLAWTLLRRTMFSRTIERALQAFVERRADIEQLFLEKAGATGKPRGLTWKQCEFQDGILLARDRANGDLIGLVPVTISFEAIPGGPMEDVEAVGNLRAGTAVLVWQHGQWTTQGRAVFNLEPREVLKNFGDSLSPI